MTTGYKLIPINESSKALEAQQKGVPTQEEILSLEHEVWLGRGGLDKDFKIPAAFVQYSSKHCKLQYNGEVCAILYLHKSILQIVDQYFSLPFTDCLTSIHSSGLDDYRQ